MWCHSKKEMLEYLGKDGKDVRYIDRAIMSGKILERKCMYIGSSEYIEGLEKEIKNLTDKIDELENELENASAGIDHSEITRRIYVYLKEVLHINVRYDDLVEFIENYPSE